MATTLSDSFGASPANMQWTVVIGDTAVLRVEFYENDENTFFDTTGWTYLSTAYDFKGDVLDELQVSGSDGAVEIVAPADITKFWGTGYRNVVAELAFDLQVTIDNETVWTPVVGTIRVIGDVTGGSL